MVLVITVAAKRADTLVDLKCDVHHVDNAGSSAVQYAAYDGLNLSDNRLGASSQAARHLALAVGSGYLNQVKWLDLSSNGVQFVSTVLCCLPNLKQLYLCGDVYMV